MSISNNCSDESSSIFCVCTDYYGNVLPEYKAFNELKQTFSCCNEIPEFFSIPNTTSQTFLVDGLRSGMSQTCSNFLVDNNISTNSELKEKLPLLYYQALLDASIFNKFSYPSNINSSYVSCFTGQIPYLVSYPSYSTGQTNYKILCGSSNIDNLKNIKYINTNIDADYSINYLMDEKGEDCKSVLCNFKYNYINNPEYNLGYEIYKSSGSIQSGNVLNYWWFWLLILLLMLLGSFLFYYLYYNGMENFFKKSVDYLNNVETGLGNVAKIHSEKNKKSHFHINT